MSRLCGLLESQPEEMQLKNFDRTPNRERIPVRDRSDSASTAEEPSLRSPRPNVLRRQSRERRLFPHPLPRPLPFIRTRRFRIVFRPARNDSTQWRDSSKHHESVAVQRCGYARVNNDRKKKKTRDKLHVLSWRSVVNIIIIIIIYYVFGTISAGLYNVYVRVRFAS